VTADGQYAAAGKYLGEEYYRAGGLPAVMRHVQGGQGSMPMRERQR